MLGALVPIEGLFNENNHFVAATATGDFSGTFAPVVERLAQINRPYEEVYNCQPAGP